MQRVAFLLLLLIGVTACSFDKTLDTLPDVNDDYIIHDQVKKYNPPVVIETVGAINPDVVFKDEETLENNIHTKWALDRLGIKIKYNWTILDVNNSYSNRIRLELVKGILPDIVTTRDYDLIQELIDSGQFMEVGELFEQHASEIWKNAMNENSEVWDFVTRDEKKYAIPILDYDYSSDPVLWIRDDWLQKLELAEPTTFIELEKVLQAFTQQDPDGNGIADTVGLSVSLLHGPNTWMADSSWIFGAFGVVPKQWIVKDDKLVYGSITDEASEGLSLMRSWIEKGYISYESQWYDEVKAAQLFISGKAGIIAGPYWMSGWPLSTLKELDPKASFKAIPLPVGEDGTVLRRGKLPVNGAILINKNMKNADAFFTYQNYLFDYYATSSGEFKHGLAKGYDWTVPAHLDHEDPTNIDPLDVTDGNYRVAAYTLTFDGARIPSKIKEETPKEVIDVLLSQSESSMKDMYVGPPTQTMKARWSFLQVLEQKTYENMLFGKMSLDDFQQFQEGWSVGGGKAITEEVNTWYQLK